VVMSTPAGRFLLYCDEENGYYVWSETGAAWTQVTMGGGAAQVSGVDPATFCAVVAWKSRVWFVAKDSTQAYYLGTNSIYGAATAFDFGPRMVRGGPLANLYSWSYDAGGGLDSLLVGVSSSGDVVIYQGTDPSAAATFSIKGSWFLGGVPYGRRLGLELGGELVLLSLAGPVQASKLIQGAPAAVGSNLATYDSAKIGPTFNLDAQSYYGNQGWAIVSNPGDNAIMVLVPTVSGTAAKPYVMSLARPGSWSIYRDQPILSLAVWNGVAYFGTPDGRVAKVGGNLDGVSLNSAGGVSGIGWSWLTGFSDDGTLNQKQVQTIQPMLECQEPSPAVNAEARYNLDISEASPPTSVASTGGNTWDNATWDSSTWGGSYTEFAPLLGAAGIGRQVAIAVRGTAFSRTSIVGVGVMYTVGGLL
jgi:hypothetical protein